MTEPKVSIIVLTYKREKLLRLTLASILSAISEIDAEILVINDDKEQSPDLGDIANEPKVKLLQNPGKGVAQARNFGADTARSPLLIFIDDDFIVNSTSISGLIVLAENDKNGAFNVLWEYPPELMDKIRREKFGRYLIKEGYSSIKDRLSAHYRWEDDALFERSNGLCSGLFAISKANFFKAGGHNEKMPFGTDVDFAKRLKDTGVKVYIASYLKAYHNEEDKVIDFSKWLKRRTFGLSNGLRHKSVPRVKYKPAKRFILQILLNNMKTLLALEKILPNYRFLDPVYRRLVNAIFATSLFEIYYYQED